MPELSFSNQRDWFVGIDSDGCAFDTMESKHKQVFIPQAIASLGFSDIAGEYRRTAERVNLYSRTRGANRFEAVAICLDELRRDSALRARVPDPAPVWEFVRSGRALSNDSFESFLPQDPPELLARILHWSRESNRRIAAELTEKRPFEGVAESLAAAHAGATTMVVSATPASALDEEWEAAGLLEHIDRVAGQEFGPKREQLAAAREAGFAPECCLMVGDAPGDHAAAEENGMLFFPIIPGREVESWREFREEGLSRFLAGTFAGSYEDRLLARYYGALSNDGG
jgi:phosphoglycolate phosphatase-like HAD superfamily hydrolase